MSVAVLVARLVLAAVFAVAGFAKLADRDGSKRAAEGFGVPAALSGPVGLLVPLAELTAAALLLFGPTAVAGAIVALALLVAFMLGIARALSRGEQPDCHCFGQLHSEPASARTLARNAGLAGVAGFVIVAGETGASAVAWLGDVDPIALAALVVVAIQARFMLSLLKQHGRLLLRVDALEAQLAGEPPEPARAPAFALPDGTTLDGLLAHELPVLLVFTDPSCGPCQALKPEIDAWREAHEGRLTIATVHRETEAANAVAAAYGADVTPMAALIRPDGTLSGPLAAGPDAIRDLVADAAAPLLAVEQHGPPPSAPARLVTDLDRNEHDLRAPRTVVFWNPACGFCEQMLDDLRAADRGDLLVISRGDPEANRALGLRSPVVLDDDWSITHAFGANGTPMAAVVAADGRVGTPLAAGADEVLALVLARADEDVPGEQELHR